jgi:D-methionine transport system permease protein
MNYDNLSLAQDLLPGALLDTIYMVFASSFFALILGLPTGVILYLTSKGQIKEHPLLYKILSTIVNIGRSFPFAILMIALIPFTRWVVGTSLGTTAAIVPLSLAAAPFFARLVEQSMQEVDRHILEATQLMGASTLQIIRHVLLQEPLPSLIAGFFTVVISLVGYSAMAGLVGGGGLGKVAIQYGYNQFNVFLMILTVSLMILLVEGIQFISNLIVARIQNKRGLLRNE